MDSSATAARRPFVPRLQKRGTPYFLIAPAILIILGVTIFPLIYSIGMSMTPLNLTRPGSGNEFIGLSNYREALLTYRFWKTLANTLIMVSVAVTFEFFIRAREPGFHGAPRHNHPVFDTDAHRPRCDRNDMAPAPP